MDTGSEETKTRRRSERQTRLQEALRDNLRRRKAQARERAAATRENPAPGPSSDATPPGSKKDGIE
jgi:hypothetical protein